VVPGKNEKPAGMMSPAGFSIPAKAQTIACPGWVNGGSRDSHPEFGAHKQLDGQEMTAPSFPGRQRD
jgi:hypothetical protein